MNKQLYTLEVTNIHDSLEVEFREYLPGSNTGGKLPGTKEQLLNTGYQHYWEIAQYHMAQLNKATSIMAAIQSARRVLQSSSDSPISSPKS